MKISLGRPVALGAALAAALCMTGCYGRGYDYHGGGGYGGHGNGGHYGHGGNHGNSHGGHGSHGSQGGHGNAGHGTSGQSGHKGGSHSTKPASSHGPRKPGELH
jgi:hypothetical protein